MPAAASKDLPLLQFATPAAWRDWLTQHHATSKGVWLKLAKTGVRPGTDTYAEALEEAICFGWIDGEKGALDRYAILCRVADAKRPDTRAKRIAAFIEMLEAHRTVH
jgi:uncharacterized protein YdeI (YjbR/CyaY-like superfamily)